MQMAQTGSFFEQIDLQGRMVRASNFALDNWWLWVVLALALWLYRRLRSQHAMLARLDERADAAMADVDALLLERRTLVGNLVEVVRGFADREQVMIRDVLKARIDAIAALGQGAMIAQDQSAGILQNVTDLSESFPELATYGQFVTLRSDLIRIDEKITAARKFYNLAVEEHNAALRAFPANLMRGATAPRDNFSLGEQRRAELSEVQQIAL
ncbi:LemA family protein [Novosphingobium olei]|uniref:LemA family protein n=1 Tax=Novosphingobium olei TaxID=2728851 RepID=UPI00308DCEEB|nr:LemA family protein [Novosphingobium olei]